MTIIIIAAVCIIVILLLPNGKKTNKKQSGGGTANLGTGFSMRIIQFTDYICKKIKELIGG